MADAIPEIPPRPKSLAALGNALRRRRESLSLTLDEIAHATGISKPYLSNIETARAPGPASPEKLKKIAHALHLPAHALLAAADWLRTPPSVRRLFDSGDATQPIENRKSKIENAPRRPDGTIDLDALALADNRSVLNPQFPIPNSQFPIFRTTPLPLINRVAAGHPAEHTDLDYPAGIADDYVHMPDLPTAPAAAFALKIQGDSMAPDYKEGEIIILASPTDRSGKSSVHDGDDCVVRLADDANFATTFKRIYYVHEGDGPPTAIRLVPLNTAYPERIVPLEQVTGIYPLLYRLVPPKR